MCSGWGLESYLAFLIIITDGKIAPATGRSVGIGSTSLGLLSNNTKRLENLTTNSLYRRLRLASDGTDGEHNPEAPHPLTDLPTCCAHTAELTPAVNI